MKLPLYAIIFLALAGVTVGIAVADSATNLITNGFLVVNGPTQINGVLDTFGNFKLNNGDFRYERTDGTQTSVRLLNPDQTTFQFEDTDDNRIYFMRYSQDGGLFDLGSVTDGGRNDFAINTTTGNVAIGHANPTEQLDVDGNIKLSGNITSDGDICIGNCP